MSVTTLLPPADSGIEQALQVSIWHQLGFILIHAITLLQTAEIWIMCENQLHLTWYVKALITHMRKFPNFAGLAKHQTSGGHPSQSQINLPPFVPVSSSLCAQTPFVFVPLLLFSCLTLQWAAHMHISNSFQRNSKPGVYSQVYVKVQGYELHLEPLIYIRERELERRPSPNAP